MRLRQAGLALLTLFAATALGARPQGVAQKPGLAGAASEDLAQALARAGGNRPELEQALRAAPPSQRKGLRFLVEHMPDRDLQTLSARFLLENAAEAYEAFAQAPWRERISEELFLNDILPYATLTEPRDGSRALLRAKAAPLVAGCETPAEAAHALNHELFEAPRIVYAAEGVRVDPAPLETLAQGKATCIGLSILLVAACRAVGIPARIAGTPVWTSGRGNGGTHEWVEIWDDGWHYLGAAEPYSEGLDHAWFGEEAAQGLRDQPLNAIYATSFRRTGTRFPLAWAPSDQWVEAVNVTDRYKAVWNGGEVRRGRLVVKVVDRQGRPLDAVVTVQPLASPEPYRGVSRGTAGVDFPIPGIIPAAVYRISVEGEGRSAKVEAKAGARAEDVVVVRMD